MLEEMLEKYEIVNSVGESIGKIKEIYIDLQSWDIKALKVSPGVIKSSFLLDIKEIRTVDLDKHRMVVGDEFEQGEIPSSPSKNMYPYDELTKRNVVDSDGQKVGKIYSLEIPYHKLGTLKVWKLLIKTGIKDRRLRISPTEVHEVMDDINLRKNIDFYQKRDAEEN
jgi:sporulation protein YlmC with PRC-barrel domain